MNFEKVANFTSGEDFLSKPVNVDLIDREKKKQTDQPPPSLSDASFKRNKNQQGTTLISININQHIVNEGDNKTQII